MTRQDMSLLTELDAFYTEHRRCGVLEAGVDEPVVWIGCACGARIARCADDGHAQTGDRFADEGFEWQVMTHPAALHRCACG